MELLLCKKKNQFPIDIIPSTIEKRASLQKEVLGKLDGYFKRILGKIGKE